MIEKYLPLVQPEERSPLVTQVRVALNVAGDDRLDAPLQELLKGCSIAMTSQQSGASI